MRYWQKFSLLLLIAFLFIVKAPLVFSQEISQSGYIEETIKISQAQTNPQNNGRNTPENLNEKSSSENNKQDVPVVLNGETIFNYSSNIEGFPAEARAKQTAEKIKKIARNSAIPLNSLKIVELEGLRVIATKEESIITLLEADARAANLSLDELAEDYLQKVKSAIAQSREPQNLPKSVLSIVLAVLEFITVVILLILLRKVINRIKRQINIWQTSLLRPLRIQNLQLFSAEQEANLLLGLVRLVYWIIVAIVLFVYLSSLIRYFPQTRRLGNTIFSYLNTLMITAVKAAIAYLPNLFTIILTIIIAYYIIRFCRTFFNAVERQTLSLPRFDREWAKPTEKLAIVLISALAFTIIFPLLPGAQSPAFQGISIFIGALFTLGGATAIANVVGGIVIIYTRAFRIGDRVRIDNISGDIIEKTILSTRIRTPKNKIVTIPNANLLTSNIENFTTSFRDIDEHLILHTTITLGYDVPWRQAHQVLIEAARSSSSILEDPSPFVLQTSLGDFAVSYELNAYTDCPSSMAKTYSQLYQNIQDKCNEAGIEILSPQYSALRDGNQNTIPEHYLPQNYTAPGFRLHSLGKLLNRPSSEEYSQETSDDRE